MLIKKKNTTEDDLFNFDSKFNSSKDIRQIIQPGYVTFFRLRSSRQH